MAESIYRTRRHLVDENGEYVTVYEETAGDMVQNADGSTVQDHVDNKENPHGVTAAQVKADPEGTAAAAVETHNSAEDAHTDIRASVTEALSIAKGRSRGVVFDTYSDMVDDLNAAVAEKYAVGDNIYIVTLGVPDLWVSAANAEAGDTYTYTTDEALVGELEKGEVTMGRYAVSRLETAKVDLSQLTEHIANKQNPHNVTAAQAHARADTWLPTVTEIGAVPTTRTVNGKPLSEDITLGATDVGARPSTWTPTATDVKADPTGTAASAVAAHNTSEEAHADIREELATKADDAATKAALGGKVDTATYNAGLATKQNTLTFDDTPKADSSNPVKSSGVFTALGNKVDTSTYNTGLAGKQGTITASGILKGDGKGAISTASAGTDYVTPSGSITGNAGTATKLAKAVTLPAVNLASSATASFDGSAAPTAVGVTGTLPITNGGTGAANAAAALAALGGQAKAVKATVTLTSSGWGSSKTQTATCTGAIADELGQLVLPCPAATSQKAYMDAGVRCTAQGANTLTFTCDTAPTTNLTVYVVMFSV